MGLQVTERYYARLSVRVINVNGITVMWDEPVITDRKILANRPDIILNDKKENPCLLIDVDIPDDSKS
jgi:hypothetical protein